MQARRDSYEYREISKKGNNTSFLSDTISQEEVLLPKEYVKHT